MRASGLQRRHVLLAMLATSCNDLHAMNDHPMNPADPADPVEHISAHGFRETVERLTAAIRSAGLRLFVTIDHAAAAADVGLHMPPTVVLLYGHPAAGTPLMLAMPVVALDLPLRVLVREDASDGHAVVAWHPAAALLARAGLSPADTHRLDAAQQLLMKAIAS